MLLDAVPYDEYAAQSMQRRRVGAIRSFIRLIEDKLGARVLFDRRRFMLGKPQLEEVGRFVEQLKERGVITYIGRVEQYPDEPPFRFWSGLCGDPGQCPVGGTSGDDDESALMASLAEALERYTWLTQTDYFSHPLRATVQEMRHHKPFIAPEAFVSFSVQQREAHQHLQLGPNATYQWIRGRSLVSGKNIYVPAQTVSAAIGPRGASGSEPLIRAQTTIGLATWPTAAGARLSGALEVIEREAYMVMWFNQFTLPKVSLERPSLERPSLARLVERCRRYGLVVHAVRMITDAPTHAVCVILEDTSGVAPRFAFGLKAHRSLAYTVEKALMEALRARSAYRRFFLSDAHYQWSPGTPTDKIGHRDRVYYWGDERNAPRLQFLIQGEEREEPRAVWEDDSEEAHLERVLAWCKSNSYECVSVSLGTSAVNPTKLHIEMVVMPDLQPTHLTEWTRHLGGTRLKTVPQQFGYTPRATPFIDEPHPFS